MDRVFFAILQEEERKKRQRERERKRDFLVLSALEEDIDKEKEKIDLCKQIMKRVAAGTFFNEDINRDKVVTFMNEFIREGSNNVKEVALETITTLCFNNQNFRARFIEANTMGVLMKVIRESIIGGIVLNALLCLETLLGAGHPGEEVATKLKNLLPQIYKKIGPNNERTWIWKMRMCVVHNLGLLSWRIALNYECTSLIREFLNEYKHQVGDAYHIKANDVRNLFQTDQLNRMLAYYIISHTLLSNDPGWDQIVEYFHANLLTDWTETTYGCFMESAAKKLQDLKPGLRDQLQRQVYQVNNPIVLPTRDPKSFFNQYPSVEQEHTRESVLPKPKIKSVSIQSVPTAQNEFIPQSTQSRGASNPPSSFQPKQASTPPSSFQPNQSSNPPSSFQSNQSSNPPSSFQSNQSSNPPSSFQPNQSSNPPSSFQPNQSSNPSSFFQPKQVSNPPSLVQPKQASTSKVSGRGSKQEVPNPRNRRNPNVADMPSVESILAEIEETDFNVDFTDIVKIDSGGFGTVYSATWRNSQVAVKAIANSLNNVAPKIVLGIKRELDIMRELRHDRTLTLLHHYRDKDNIYLVTKYYERKSLYHVLHIEDLHLNKDDFCILVIDICNGLIYLHNHVPQILHLDLKPKNILIDGVKEHRAVIADFGLSVMKRESHSQSRIQPRGTYPYMAPEILSGNSTDKTDIYSFSIIMWEMLFNSEPYPKATFQMETILPIVKGGLRPKWVDDAEIDFEIPVEVKNLVEQCWNGEPIGRPSASQVLEVVKLIHNDPDVNF